MLKCGPGQVGLEIPVAAQGTTRVGGVAEADEAGVTTSRGVTTPMVSPTPLCLAKGHESVSKKRLGASPQGCACKGNVLV